MNKSLSKIIVTLTAFAAVLFFVDSQIGFNAEKGSPRGRELATLTSASRNFCSVSQKCGFLLEKGPDNIFISCEACRADQECTQRFENLNLAMVDIWHRPVAVKPYPQSKLISVGANGVLDDNANGDDIDIDTDCRKILPGSTGELSPQKSN